MLIPVLVNDTTRLLPTVCVVPAPVQVNTAFALPTAVNVMLLPTQTVGDIGVINGTDGVVQVVATIKLLTAVAQPTDVQATAVIVVEPGDKLTAQLHELPAVAVAVHKTLPNWPVNVIMVPGAAVPLTVGVVVTVLLVAGLKIVTLGALTGATAVTLIIEAELLPPLLLAIAVIVVDPGDKLTAQLHKPPAVAATVHKTLLAPT